MGKRKILLWNFLIQSESGIWIAWLGSEVHWSRGECSPVCSESCSVTPTPECTRCSHEEMVGRMLLRVSWHLCTLVGLWLLGNAGILDCLQSQEYYGFCFSGQTMSSDKCMNSLWENSDFIYLCTLCPLSLPANWLSTKHRPKCKGIFHFMERTLRTHGIISGSLSAPCMVIIH